MKDVFENLERKDPIADSAETATDLLERALDSGVQIENVGRRRATDESLRFVGGLVVVQQHVEIHDK